MYLYLILYNHVSISSCTRVELKKFSVCAARISARLSEIHTRCTEPLIAAVFDVDNNNDERLNRAADDATRKKREEERSLSKSPQLTAIKRIIGKIIEARSIGCLSRARARVRDVMNAIRRTALIISQTCGFSAFSDFSPALPRLTINFES